jgi:HK97 gp10 family phage protein
MWKLICKGCPMPAEKVTAAQLCKKLEKIPKATAPALQKAMGTCVLHAESKAKENCWPGTSPYWKAPHRTGRMRRSITSRVDVNKGSRSVSIRGLIGIIAATFGDDGGIKVFYPLFVHEGTSKMKARPFLLDAALATRDKNIKLLVLTLQQAVKGAVK